MSEDWHHITVSLFMYSTVVAFPQRYGHQTFISFLTSPLHASHICLLTPCALDMTQIRGHWIRSAETWSRLGLAFIYGPVFFFSQHRQRVTESGGKAHLCSPTHAVLTISTSSTLSFGSGTLTNMPHQFLMHNHMVVLFFFRYCAK